MKIYDDWVCFVLLFVLFVTMNSAPRLVLTNLDRSGGKSEYYSADINLKVSSRTKGGEK